MELHTTQQQPAPVSALDTLKVQLSYGELCELYVRIYGPAVSRAQAAKIIKKTSTTVRNMLEDGRLRAACEGELVDVTSLVRYMLIPKQIEFEARAKKRMAKTGCKFYV